jgi:general secretion pathway protein B
MSYILDALKKSERERTLVRGVGFADAARQVARRTDWLPWIIGGIVVTTVALIATAFVMRDRLVPPRVTAAAAKPPAVAPPTVEAQPSPAPVSAPVAAPSAVAAVATAPALPPLPEASVEVPPTAPPAPAVFLTELPPDFQQSVPPMTVNIHVYAPDEMQRILYINNRQYYRGDEISGGVVVEEIVPEGVVLEFRGQRFKLPRPS